MNNKKIKESYYDSNDFSAIKAACRDYGIECRDKYYDRYNVKSLYIRTGNGAAVIYFSEGIIKSVSILDDNNSELFSMDCHGYNLKVSGGILKIVLKDSRGEKIAYLNLIGD